MDGTQQIPDQHGITYLRTDGGGDRGLRAVRMLAFASTLLVTACAHHPAQQELKLTVAESGSLGRTGLALGRYSPPRSLNPDRPGFIKAPAKGLGEGAVAGTEIGLGLAAGFGCLPCLPGVPAFTALGAIAGTGVGIYEAGVGLYRSKNPKFDRAYGALETTYSEIPFADLFEQALLAATANRTTLPVGSYSGGPQSVKDEPDYTNAADFDTLVEVRLTNIGLEDKGGYDSPRKLRMQARARVVRTSDQRPLHDQMYTFESQGLTLAEWTADDRALFKEVLRRGVESLASDVAKSIFRI
jgi:hypothetical protein